MVFSRLPGSTRCIGQGDFSLTTGTVLDILVGQMGENTRNSPVDNAAPDGGGGTFVYISPTSPFPLFAAGGGGRGGRDMGLYGATTASNGNPALVGGLGGSAGNGGLPNNGGSSYWAGGGAGWLSDGTGGNNTTSYVYTPGSSGALGGRRPANGGAEGRMTEPMRVEMAVLEVVGVVDQTIGAPAAVVDFQAAKEPGMVLQGILPEEVKALIMGV